MDGAGFFFSLSIARALSSYFISRFPQTGQLLLGLLAFVSFCLLRLLHLVVFISRISHTGQSLLGLGAKHLDGACLCLFLSLALAPFSCFHL